MFLSVPGLNHCYHWDRTKAYSQMKKKKISQFNKQVKRFDVILIDSHRSANAAVLGQMRASTLPSSTCSVHKQASPPSTCKPNQKRTQQLQIAINMTDVCPEDQTLTCFILIGSKCIRSHGRCL